MAGPLYFDRVQETTTTSGTGTYTLAGAVTGFQSFAAVGDTNTCYYAVTDGVDWEVGLGTYASSGTTLARTAILASSNGGSAVSWSGATKNIWVDSPALFFSGLVTSSGSFSPTANDGKALGTTALGWSDLMGATGFTINLANGDWVATHSSGILTVGTGDLRVTTAGTDTASVVTVGGSQNLTNKTLTSPIIATDITIPNTGLHLLDTNASHDLIIAPGSDLTADRTLTLTTGDAARTVTIGGNTTISQDYSTTGNPQFATIELGAATDTTLSRASAGNLAVEGNVVYRAGGTDVPVADGGTGLSTLTANNVILGNGASSPTFVAPGTSGNVLTSNGTTWTSAAAASGGLTLLGTITTTSGSSQSLTSIPTGYVYLLLNWVGVSCSANSTTVTIAASSTNGAAYGTGGTFTMDAADLINGAQYIYNYTSAVAAGKVLQNNLRNSAGTGVSVGSGTADTNTAAALNAIRVSVSTGAWDAGSILVYGVK